jgi:hypothetical protein
MKEENSPQQRTRCEVWTRVMGYYRPVSHYNVGKKAEHMSRKHFEEVVVANKQFIKQYSVQPAQAAA